jgi:hypothetical protein
MVKNSIIDTVVPIFLIIIAVAFIYWKFGEPLKRLWHGIKSALNMGGGKVVEAYQGTREIIYEPG